MSLAHLNTSYRHFFLFVHEVGFYLFQSALAGLEAKMLQFDLIDKKELAPLSELNEAILAEDKSR